MISVGLLEQPSYSINDGVVGTNCNILELQSAQIICSTIIPRITKAEEEYRMRKRGRKMPKKGISWLDLTKYLINLYLLDF